MLVVEGATEHLLLPRVTHLLRIPLDDDYVAIEDAGGVDRDISPLIAYLAPRFEDPVPDKHVDFRRPPTRFLIVFAAEGSAATQIQREALRAKWVDRIMRTFPPELKTDIVREDIVKFVRLVTWRPSGESFEFAHFTRP